MLYFRKKKSTVWHFMEMCGNFPISEDRVVSKKKPKTGEFCNECLAKAKRKVVRTANRDR